MQYNIYWQKFQRKRTQKEGNQQRNNISKSIEPKDINFQIGRICASNNEWKKTCIKAYNVMEFKDTKDKKMLKLSEGALNSFIRNEKRIY